MRFLDANPVIRYLTQDDPAKGAACAALFRRVTGGEEEVLTCEAVVAETVYVLSSRALYGLNHEEIRSRLSVILGFRGLRMPNKRVCQRALDIYAEHAALDFEDALCIAHMEAEHVAEILSYDRDFDRVAGIARVEP